MFLCLVESQQCKLIDLYIIIFLKQLVAIWLTLLIIINKILIIIVKLYDSVDAEEL